MGYSSSPLMILELFFATTACEKQCEAEVFMKYIVCRRWNRPQYGVHIEDDS